MRTIWLGCFLASSVVPALAQSSLYGILLGQPISTQLQACPKESRAVKTACWTRDEWPDVTDLPNMLETPQCIARGQQLISRPESYYRIHLPQKAMPGVTKLMVLERDGSVQVIIARVTADHDVEHDFLMRFGKPSTQRRPRLGDCMDQVSRLNADKRVWRAQWQDAPDFVVDFDGVRGRIVLMTDSYASSMAAWERLCDDRMPQRERWGQQSQRAPREALPPGGKLVGGC